MSPNNLPIIVCACATDTDITFFKKISKLGFNPVVMPVIQSRILALSQKKKETLKRIASFDWVIFTSGRGVKFSMVQLQQLGLDENMFKKIKIAAVGEKTAEALTHFGLKAAFVPSAFTDTFLAKELPLKESDKILLLHSQIASAAFFNKLQSRGAAVEEISMYTIESIKVAPKLEHFLNSPENIFAIIFTSPSAVRGFLTNLNPSYQSKINKKTVVAIGPITQKYALKSGFKRVYTADTFSSEGIYQKLSEIT